MALAPLPLASQSYDLLSAAASAGRAVNLYAEKLPAGARSPFILKPAPGLVALTAVGSGPIRALAAIPGYLYVVSGDQLCRVDEATMTPVALGVIGNSATPSIAVGADQVVVVSPPNAYVASHSGMLQQITQGSGNFPVDGASSVAYIDGYFVFTSAGGEYFFCSSLLDALHFDSLDFAKSERRPDFVRKVIAHRGELWLFGEAGVAVWYDAGAADFPFRERAGAQLQQGLGAIRTLAELDNSLFWVGHDRIVYRTNGYAVARVSSHAIEEMLAAEADLSTLTGFSWLWEGHAFYALTSATRTVVYDVATEMWHDRSSAADGNGPWSVACATSFGRRVVVGDPTFAALYTLQARNGMEPSGLIYREAVLPSLVTHGPRAFMSRLEVEMEVGTFDTPGTVRLDWSDDGGITWGPERSLPTGAIGATRTRVATNRLGSFRQRDIRLRCSGSATFYGVDADTGAGAA
jgi:hypothetical protein